MNYRNKKLLEFAKDCPVCMCCDEPNDGTVVAAHSNQLRDGKGMGIKAHDYRIAYLKFEHHMEIDQGKNLSKQEKIDRFEYSHRKSIGWLFETGRIVASGAKR